MRNFDTCFFERYARICLTTVLGEQFAALVNEDRPDLQMPDKSLGIEVTRAMEPRKDVAQDLLLEMAGVESPADNDDEMGQILRTGYGYGLQEGKYNPETGELDLIRDLSRLPEEIRLAAVQRDPSRLNRYASQVATAFHKFYTECRIKDAAPALREARILLSCCTAAVIENALSCFGVSAPDHM